MSTKFNVLNSIIRVIERYPRNKNVRSTWWLTVITNNNNRSKKYIHGISTND